MNIAIVGAGVSGLLVAYKLKQQADNAAVYIYDKTDRIGGNVDTRNFRVGQSYVSHKEAHRWADMGVNDFNLTQYRNIYDLLNKFGFKKGVELLKLENSTSFSNEDGSISYYINEDGSNTMSEIVSKDYQRFQRHAPEYVLTNHKSHNKTVEDYLNEHNYSEEFREQNLYPRINGMYFVNGTHPKDMPIKAVMDYYGLQEGFGHEKKPYRVYLKDGMSSWIQKLYEHCGAKLITVDHLDVLANPDNAIISSNKGDHKFDAVFICCHADTADKIIKTGKTEKMKSVFGAYKYNDSTAIAHTYSSVLPPDRAAWKTYNIYIHNKKQKKRPYTISYVCNRHQNDKENPSFDHFENPEYFVSLNPHKEIPDKFILKDEKGNPMIQNFRHNVVDFKVLDYQKDKTVLSMQGENNLYFAGGWVIGAGLHEQCYEAAHQAVTKFIHKEVDFDRYYYTPGAPPEEYAPKYLREKFSHFFDRSES